MSNTRLHFAVLIKSKTPRSPSPRSVQLRSTSTTPRLRKASLRSIGQRAFSAGTSAQSSTARTIQPPRAFLHKHGWKPLELSVLHLYLRFFRTKICVAFARRSRHSAIRSCCQKSAATARLRRQISRKFSLALLHHSPTPSLHPLPKHWSWRAPNR